MIKKIIRTILFTPVAILMTVLFPGTMLFCWIIMDEPFKKLVTESYSWSVIGVYKSFWKSKEV